MNWIRLAIAPPLLLFAYQLVLDWVNLFPWNDLAAKSARTRALEFVLNYSPLLLIAYAFWRPSRVSELYGLLGSVAYLLGHLNAWWRPYLLGATPREQAEYQAQFARTHKFLPARRDHPVPDAAHIGVGLLCLLLVLGSGLAYWWG